jgi:hypothetical protein
MRTEAKHGLRQGILISLLLLAAAAAAPGCANDPRGGNDGDLGHVRIALDATSAAGATYRLQNAQFLITGPQTLTLSGDTPTVEQDLPPGSYQITLLSGFSISVVNADGTLTPLQATLTSPNPQAFGIRSGHTSNVTFAFKVGEIVVTTGDGTLTVTASIDDSLIDDFEDGDGQLAHLAGRGGTWFIFNDGTGSQTPVGPTLPIVDANANFVMRTTGTGFAFSNGNPDFGAGIGANLVDDPNQPLPLPYDASAYAGITFTYSFNSSEFGAELRFNFSTSATTPISQGGTCVTNCNDDFGFNLFPTFGAPQTISIPFSQLSQQSFGSAATFDPSTILNIKWNITFFEQPGDFDLTLDNISFLPAAAH